MSTTFVLHGGATSTESPKNDEFFSCFTSLVNKDEVKVLMCYFAREKKNWVKLLNRDKPKILGNTKKKVTFTVPTDPKDLLSKLNSHDVLYVAGGTAELIEPMYDDLTSVKDKLKGKVYLGSSMGAFMISKNYVLSFDEQDDLDIHKGLGLLPINCLVHWDQEKKKEEKIGLIKRISDLPILTLDECESVIFYL